MQRRVLTTAAVAVAMTFGVVPASAEPQIQVVPDPAAYVNPFIGTTNLGNTFPGAVTPFGMLAVEPGDHARQPDAHRGARRLRVRRARGSAASASPTCPAWAARGAHGDIPIMPYVGDGDDARPPPTPPTPSTPAPSRTTNEIAPSPATTASALDSGVDGRAHRHRAHRLGAVHLPGRQAGDAAAPHLELARSAAPTRTVHIDAATRTVTGSVTSGNFCGYLRPEQPQQLLHAALHRRSSTSRSPRRHLAGRHAARRAAPPRSGGTGYGTNGWPAPGQGLRRLRRRSRRRRTVDVARRHLLRQPRQRARQPARPRTRAGTTFDDVERRAARRWNEQLGQIGVGGGTDDQQTTFYTALYHALLHPTSSATSTASTRASTARHTASSRPQLAQYAQLLRLGRLPLPGAAADAARPEDGAATSRSPCSTRPSQNGGVWDRWTHTPAPPHVMNGDPAPTALAGIYAFGGRDFDVERALTRW